MKFHAVDGNTRQVGNSVSSLIKHIARQETGGKARILLVARHRGVWFDQLQQETPELDSYPPETIEAFR